MAVRQAQNEAAQVHNSDGAIRKGLDIKYVCLITIEKYFDVFWFLPFSILVAGN